MLTLYYSPGACSLAVHAALVHVGEPHRLALVNVRQGENLTPDYAAINPRRRVPALATPDGLLTEAAGLLSWLDARQPDAELLPSGFARGKALEWISWFSSTVHPLYRAFWRTAYFAEDESAHAAIKETSARRILDAMRELDDALADRDTLSGGPVGAAEFYAVPFVRWTRNTFPQEAAKLTHVARFFERIATHPAVAVAARREGITLWPDLAVAA